MKNFIGIFAICYVLSLLFLTFGGLFAFQNLYILLIFTSLIMAGFINELVKQDDRIEALEKRIKQWDKDTNQEEILEDNHDVRTSNIEADN